MTVYVLIFALWSSVGGGGPAVAYFVDREACEAAATAIRHTHPRAKIIVRCLEDVGGEH